MEELQRVVLFGRGKERRRRWSLIDDEGDRMASIPAALTSDECRKARLDGIDLSADSYSRERWEFVWTGVSNVIEN